MRSDGARNQDRAFESLVDDFDVGTRQSFMPLADEAQIGPLAPAQIALTRARKTVEITEQPIPGFRIAAVAFPYDVDG